MNSAQTIIEGFFAVMTVSVAAGAVMFWLFAKDGGRK